MIPGIGGKRGLALKAYTGNMVGTYAIDGKDPFTVENQISAVAASGSALLSYPIVNFFPGAKPTVQQMITAEVLGQSFESLINNRPDYYDNGYQCIKTGD